MDSILPGLSRAQNIHPLFVHFPLALWALAVLFYLVGALREQEELVRFGRWLLYFGTLGGLLAVGSGLWATSEMGHDAPGHDMVHTHRNLMLVATGLAALVCGAAFLLRKLKNSWARWGLVCGLGVTNLVATLGADRGALLVFSYGVGVSRLVAAIAEQHHDEKGLVWPAAVAPAHVHVVAAGKGEQVAAALRLGEELSAGGLDVIVDDRAGLSVGVRLTDAELIGAPWIVVVGRRLGEGLVELRSRADGETRDVPLAEVQSLLKVALR